MPLPCHRPTQCPEVSRCVTRGPVTAVGASLSGCVAHALPGLPTVVRSGASVQARSRMVGGKAAIAAHRVSPLPLPQDSVLHPGVTVSAAAAVRRAVLLTCSGADRAATVAESVLAAGALRACGGRMRAPPDPAPAPLRPAQAASPRRSRSRTRSSGRTSRCTTRRCSSRRSGLRGAGTSRTGRTSARTTRGSSPTRRRSRGASEAVATRLRAC